MIHDFFLNWYKTSYVVANIVGYELSFVELIGTISGLITVWLQTRSNIFAWPIGIINTVALFVLFYQINLYADMFLQVYYFVMCIYGWVYWGKQKNSHQPKKNIGVLNAQQRLKLLLLILASTVVMGFITQKLHVWLPAIFTIPASYPYTDSLATTASIIGNWLLARRILENWAVWVFVNVLSIGLYIAKDVRFIALQFVIYLVL